MHKAERQTTFRAN